MLTQFIRKSFERRDLLRKLIGGSVVGAAALAGVAPRAVKAAEAPVTMATVKNIGLCVQSAERAKKFYVEAFGFNGDAKPVKIGAMLEPLLETKDLDLTIQYVDTG